MPHCPVLNSPYPDSASGRGHHVTNSGWRAEVQQAFAPRTSPRWCMSNLAPPPADAFTLGVVANSEATPEDIEQAKDGFELLASKRLWSRDIPLYWIVGGSVVLERSFALDTGELSPASFGEECRKIAQQYAQSTKLCLGTLWLFPSADGQWHFGGLDRFPPAEHLDDDASTLAAAICDRYASLDKDGI